MIYFKPVIIILSSLRYHNRGNTKSKSMEKLTKLFSMKNNIFNPLKSLFFQKDEKCDTVMKSVHLYNFLFPSYSENGYFYVYLKIVSEYDQEIPQLQTADNPVAPGGRAA